MRHSGTVAGYVLAGLLVSLLAVQLAQASAIDAFDTDDLMVPKDLSSLTRARYPLICGRFRGDEIMFTGGCYLLKPNFLALLNSIPKEILEFDPEKNVDDLLRAFLPRMFVYFEQKYPEYRGNLSTFFKTMDELGAKLKTSTSNVNMIEVDAAFEGSGLWKAKQELIDKKAAITASTQNLTLEQTNAILADYKCDSDSLFCTYTNDVFGIADTNNWNTLTITEVLAKGVNNSITYLKDPFLGLDFQKIFGLLTDLDRLGTGQVKVSRVHTLLNDTKYWKSLVNVFETENYAPPTEPTTVTKTTRTSTQRVKVIPKVAVTKEWYLSVPLVVLGVGILVAFALYLNTKPARNQVQTNKQQPQQQVIRPQPGAQFPKPAEMPYYSDPRQPTVQQIEMKPRISSDERAQFQSNRMSDRRAPAFEKTARQLKEEEAEERF